MSGAAHLPGGTVAGGVYLPGKLGVGGYRPEGAAAGVHLPTSMATGDGCRLEGAVPGVHLPASMVTAGGYRLGGAGVHLPGGLPASGYRPAGPVPDPAQLETLPSRDAVSSGRPALVRPLPGEMRLGAVRLAGLQTRGIVGPQHLPGEDALVGGLVDRPPPSPLQPGVAQAAFRPAPIVPRDPLRDPRLGVAPDRAIRGLASGYALPRPPRPFLHLDAHRDVGADYRFVGNHLGDFPTRLVRDMAPHERALWRAGLWRNEWHYGRRGWWWEANGAWYPYADPVWPYPAAVAAMVVYAIPTVDGADLAPVEITEGETAPAAPGSSAVSSGDGRIVEAANGVPPLPAAPTGWYRCAAPDGFYPTQAACGGGWELVQTPPLPGE